MPRLRRNLQRAHTALSDVTVKQAVDAWLTAKAIRVKPAMRDAYSAPLAPVVDRYGHVKVQAITKRDVEALVTDLREGSHISWPCRGSRCYGTGSGSLLEFVAWRGGAQRDHPDASRTGSRSS